MTVWHFFKKQKQNKKQNKKNEKLVWLFRELEMSFGLGESRMSRYISFLGTEIQIESEIDCWFDCWLLKLMQILSVSKFMFGFGAILASYPCCGYHHLHAEFIALSLGSLLTHRDDDQWLLDVWDLSTLKLQLTFHCLLKTTRELSLWNITLRLLYK